MIKGNSSRTVTINGEVLSPHQSQLIRNHSPDGFSWGYGGSGPSQLSLALLLNYFPKWVALKYYMEFKFRLVANLPNEFEIEEDEVVQTLIELLSEEDSERLMAEYIG